VWKRAGLKLNPAIWRRSEEALTAMPKQ